MCDLEAIGVTSMFNVIRRTATLANTRPAFAFNDEKNDVHLKWN